MIDSAVVYTMLPESAAAGTALGEQISAALHNQRPDALIVFASSQYDYAVLLQALQAACQPALLVGCSSAGEFTSSAQGEGAACAIALRSDELHFTVGVAEELSHDRAAAARQLVAAFRGMESQEYLYHSALVLTDALAGHADDLVEQLTLLTGGTYQFFGGGAGDDARFERTYIFYGTQVLNNAVVALEILSNKPLGIGVSHGWQPASPGMRVTDADGMRLISVNAMPAVELFEEHAERTGQHFDPADPMPFFLHNVLGIETGSGYQLRVPLGIHSDGSVGCAADIPVGATIHVMGVGARSAVAAAANATTAALQQLNGHQPKVALFFDCVATRLRMGKEFGFELQAVQQRLGSARYAGFNTYGQIARAEGQFSGFHNCTAVVCIIPE